MTESDALLRELNHRVNNNFQIVVSLMNLKKRLLPVDRQDDIRFIEEHVQSMAVAYRLIYATGLVLEVPIGDLVIDVVLGLRLIAKLASDRISVVLEAMGGRINLDQGIALALYLAVVLPPYLDVARSQKGHIRVKAAIVGTSLSLAIEGDWEEPIEMDFLRERLMAAYVSQLGGIQDIQATPIQHDLRFSVAPTLAIR